MLNNCVVLYKEEQMLTKLSAMHLGNELEVPHILQIAFPIVFKTKEYPQKFHLVAFTMKVVTYGKRYRC